MPEDMAQHQPSSEQELVERAREGDEAALAALFERCEGRTRHLIRRGLAPAVRRKVSDSDIFQDVLATAVRRLDSFEYRGEGSFQRWVAGIAEYQRRDAVRRHTQAAKRDVRAEVSRDGRPDTRHAIGPGATPSRLAMAEEMRERIADALSELPEAYRTVIQLLDRRRISFAEAGQLMGRSENAAKKLHARALSELARRVGLDDRRSS